MPVYGHGKKQLVANCLLLVVGCITPFWLVLFRFELLRILVQLKGKYLFSRPMKIHSMLHKVKKQNNFILSSLVTWTCQMCFFIFFQVSNNRAVIITCFVLESSHYNVYVRPCNSQFYLLILPVGLFHFAQSFSLKLKRNTTQMVCW